MLIMKDRSFLYELRAYLIYVKVGERSFIYELRAYLIYVKVGENYFCQKNKCCDHSIEPSQRDLPLNYFCYPVLSGDLKLYWSKVALLKCGFRHFYKRRGQYDSFCSSLDNETFHTRIHFYSNYSSLRVYTHS